MARAAFVSLQLARFDTLRAAGILAAGSREGVMFCAVAADTSAAATTPASMEGFTFLVLGLHASAASARALVDDRPTLAPWLAEATELWGGVLEPYRHRGEANYLDRAHPAPVFERHGRTPAANAPMVALTSSGWIPGPRLFPARVGTFSAGVLGVRASMTAVDGLHSQQSFHFPGDIALDPITVTFWREDAALRAWAYGPGVHKLQMERDRDEHLSDRTSFTRCRVVHGEGTWRGTDPLAWPARAAGA